MKLDHTQSPTLGTPFGGKPAGHRRASDPVTMTYRVYFNRWQDAPNVWSVDDGTQATERTVREVRLHNVSARTRFGPGDNQKSPTVWIEVQGELVVSNGVAWLLGEAEAEQRSVAA